MTATVLLYGYGNPGRLDDGRPSALGQGDAGLLRQSVQAADKLGTGQDGGGRDRRVR